MYFLPRERVRKQKTKTSTFHLRFYRTNLASISHLKTRGKNRQELLSDAAFNRHEILRPKRNKNRYMNFRFGQRRRRRGRLLGGVVTSFRLVVKAFVWFSKFSRTSSVVVTGSEPPLNFDIFLAQKFFRFEFPKLGFFSTDDFQLRDGSKSHIKPLTGYAGMF